MKAKNTEFTESIAVVGAFSNVQHKYFQEIVLLQIVIYRIYFTNIFVQTHWFLLGIKCNNNHSY